MPRNFNAFSRRTIEFGGGVPVWAEFPKQCEGGGLIANTFSADDIVPAASPVEFNIDTHAAKILKVYKVKTLADSVDTLSYKITLDALPGRPIPVAGEFVMVIPSTITGTGKALAVPATIDTSVEGEITFELLKANFDAPVVGTANTGYLAQSSATAAGSGKYLYCQPNSLTINDCVIATQNLVGIARGCKYVYKNTMPPAPDVILNNVKCLEFAFKGELQNSGYIS